MIVAHNVTMRSYDKMMTCDWMGSQMSKPLVEVEEVDLEAL
jgi:hypothetical protein